MLARAAPVLRTAARSPSPSRRRPPRRAGLIARTRAFRGGGASARSKRRTRSVRLAACKRKRDDDRTARGPGRNDAPVQRRRTRTRAPAHPRTRASPPLPAVLRDAVQNLLRPAHHPELLPPDSLLQHRIGLQPPLVPPERVDDVLRRVDRALQSRLALLLMEQVARAVLATLDREREGAEHTGGDEDSPESPAAAGSLSRCHLLGLTSHKSRHPDIPRRRRAAARCAGAGCTSPRGPCATRSR